MKMKMKACCFLSIMLSLVFGISYIILITRFPKLSSSNAFMTFMPLLFSLPLVYVAYRVIPVTITIEIKKTHLLILTIVVGLLSFLCIWYFAHDETGLFDAINPNPKILMIMVIPFSFFSFFFVVLTNTLLKLKFSGKFSTTCIIIGFMLARGFFYGACAFLLKTLLVFLRVYLIKIL